MYSMTLSSSRYLTERLRLMRRRASVDETSLATQFVTMWMLRRYLLSRSESKINCSGLLPLRVMTTIPCWPRIDSSFKQFICHLKLLESFSNLRHQRPKDLAWRKIPASQLHTAVWSVQVPSSVSHFLAANLEDFLCWRRYSRWWWSSGSFGDAAKLCVFVSKPLVDIPSRRF